MIQAGIIGATGYTAGELFRILVQHPEVALKMAVSRSMAGEPVHKAHPYLRGHLDLTLSEQPEWDGLDVVFLALPHGVSKDFLEEHAIPESIKVIDLSRDLRFPDSPSPSRNPHLQFEYGLVELNAEKVRNAQAVANPGCFATLIQLALLPLIEEGVVQDKVHIAGITGSTGAGKELRPTTHFTWRHSNLSVYKTFEHQHIDEVEANLPSPSPKGIYFSPIRGDFTRGMMVDVQTEVSLDEAAAKQLFRDRYADFPQVIVCDEPPSLKEVTGTNKCFLFLKQKDDVLLINGHLDNLTKGAAGQAVQNMNLMFGKDLSTGLNFPGPGY